MHGTGSVGQRALDPPLQIGRLDEDLDDGVGASASYVRFGWMESDAVNRLVVFLSVRCDLLDATFRLQVPQSQRAIVT